MTESELEHWPNAKTFMNSHVNSLTVLSYSALHHSNFNTLSITREMAKQKSTTAQPPKLPRLPDCRSISFQPKLDIHELIHPPLAQKIQKRPLLHAPIPSPYSSSQKTIYISSSTPFVATIKRVRTLLSHIEFRASGPIDFSRNRIGTQITAGIKSRRGEKEEIILKGTGKAVERVLGMVVYWQGQEDVEVRVRTGSVGAVDDVVERGDGEEVGESRVRRVSCLEVGISLR